MLLAELAASLPGAELRGDPHLSVTGISYDSRQVVSGDLFCCVRGLKDDGHQYVPDAVRRGAVAILANHPLELPVAQLIAPDTREAMALVAAAFFGHPSRRLSMVGGTGTNGKTTTAHLIEAVLAEAGYRTGLVGTVFNKAGDQMEPAERTTPESLDLQRLLRRMVHAGVQWVSMEVSSHALEMHRVTGCEFDQAVFTNITRDHFDFHSEFPRYLSAKARLFQDLGRTNHKAGPKTAILNADDPQTPGLASLTRARVVTYGLGPADVRAVDVHLEPLSSSFVVQAPGRVFQVRLQLPGYFNVSNALAAAAAALHAQVPPEVIAQALGKVTTIPGRYEVIDLGQDFTVIVDFAHNPDALANILRIPPARPDGRKIVVFGAEWGKDRGKRPLMGEAAMRGADHCIITADNIYHEDPAEVAAEVARGAAAAGKPAAYEVIIERRDAIARALDLAQPGDLVIIAGKGHETYQVMNGWKRPFDDRAVVRELLRQRLPAEPPRPRRL